jgi:hypothetical protein
MKDKATILEAARMLSEPEERRQYLDFACKDDPKLRGEVEAMIEAADQAQRAASR